MAVSLTPGQQAFVENGREALAASHGLDLGAATEGDLCRTIGRLEIVLAHVLRVIDELTEAE
ncbi:hypothetical protein ACIBEA_29965 [Streptomyces sp. NPDC051555]|uniref:hypothetical protein n=1 Tax=Streptomyces sp. NPDC051555 TaxID=3365657 RepID=UPI003792FA69